MNIINKLFDGYCAWISGWTPAHFGFFLQAVLLFSLPTLLCILAFRCGSRSVFVQMLAFVVGLLLAASIQVEKLIPKHGPLKASIFMVCVVLLVFVPSILSRLITPQLGKQRKLQTLFYGILTFLFLLNLIVKDQS